MCSKNGNFLERKLGLFYSLNFESLACIHLIAVICGVESYSSASVFFIFSCIFILLSRARLGDHELAIRTRLGVSDHLSTTKR